MCGDLPGRGHPERGDAMSREMGLLPRDPYNLIIAGVGGQGNVILSRIVGTMLVRRGLWVTIGESFGAAQRGGSVMSHIRVSQGNAWSPIMPKGRADAIIALEPVEGLRMLAVYGNPETVALINSRPIFPSAVTAGDHRYPPPEEMARMAGELSRHVTFVPATQAALRLGNPVLGGAVMLGAMAAVVGLPLDDRLFEEVASELLPKEKRDQNLRAFELGATLVKDAKIR